MNQTSYEKWIHKLINSNGRKEELSLESIRSYQLKRIKKTIQYVKQKSRFYNKTFKDISHSDINSLNDFAKLPFTSQNDLINRPLDFLCVPQHLISRITTLKTSGTTGKQKRIYFTERDLESTIDFFHNGMKYLVSSGDRILILMPGHYYGSIGDLLRRGLDRLNCYSIIAGPVENEIEMLDLLKDENIDCIVGIPVQIYGLSKVKLNNKKYSNIALKSVLLTADYVPNVIRQLVETAFCCNVLTHYGMTEMGFGGGVECKCKSGYHLREADLYFEIIDPISGEILPAGESGEIVFTTITREGMPLIRYKTGDLAKFNIEACSCGSILPSLDYVKARVESGLIIDGIIVDIGVMDEIMFSLENILDYKICLKEGNKLQVWVKSIDSKRTVTETQIMKAMEVSKIAKLLIKRKLTIECLGQMKDMKPSTGMIKRKIEL